MTRLPSRMASDGDRSGGSAGASQLGQLAIRALPAIVGAVGFVGFVAVLGGAIDWIRFHTVGLPADQAVHAVGRSELVATGAVSLVSFTLLGGLAVLTARLIDPHVHATRGLLRGVVVAGLVELIVVLVFAAAHLGLWLTVLGSFIALAMIANASVCRLDASREERQQARDRRDALEPALAEVTRTEAAVEVLAGSGAFEVRKARDARAQAVSALRALCPTVPIAQLRDRARGELWEQQCAASARLRCAPAGFLGGLGVVIAIVLLPLGWWASSADAYHWVRVMFVFVVVLNAAVFGVARVRASFGLYGAALFFSVPLFGAALAVERTFHRPKVQPVALIRKSSDRMICGVYVGESDGRVYVGRVESKPGSTVRAASAAGRMFWVPVDDIDMITIGQAQPVPDALVAAPKLALELFGDRAEDPGLRMRPTVITRTRTSGGMTRTTRQITIQRAGQIVPPRAKRAPRVGPECT